MLIALSAVVAMTTLPALAVTESPSKVHVTSEIHHDTSPPLRSITPAPSPTRGTRSITPVRRKESPDAPLREGAEWVGEQTEEAIPAEQASALSGPAGPDAPATASGWDGLNINSVSGNVTVGEPPDPQVATGPTQVVEIVNSYMAVYSKTGAVVLSPRNTNTLWAGFGGSCQTANDGDGNVVYDTLSNRWLLSQFAVKGGTFAECVAVSATSDATGAYYRYAFAETQFPDYPKSGVWPDAYYFSFNLFTPAGAGFLNPQVCAYDRAKMLTGAAATQQCIDVNSSYFTLLPASIDGTTPPPAGAPEWLVGLSPNANKLSYFKMHVDWANSANTSLSAASDLSVNAFTEPAATPVVQPDANQKLDSLGDRLMYRLAYRNFGDHESMVVSHGINVTSPSPTHIGMRWYELRPSGSALTVFQQGTYSPDAQYRWMGSIAQDHVGDMGLGYSLSSSTTQPSVAYTGRATSDPVGTMQPEVIMKAGVGSQDGHSRWGDYSEMSVDPADDCTFWYVNEYMPAGNTDFAWRTWIGSFKFPSCASNTPFLTSSPASVTFPNQAVGTTGGAQTVTISNTGTGAATGVNASISGTNAADFTKTADTCTGSTINAGSNCTISMTFTPSASGSRSASLSVTSNAAPLSVSLAGTGFTPDNVAPSQVTGLAATPGDTIAVLSWNAATDNIGVDHYVVYRGATDIGHPTSTSFTASGLVNGTPYTFQVSAVDAAGNEGAKSTAVTVTPATPPDAWPGWSQFHGDPAHTGFSAGTSDLATPTIRQSISLGNDPVAEPLIVDLDGDGAKDVVAVTKQSTSAGHTTVVAERQVGGALQPLWSYTFASQSGSPTTSYANIAIGDLNGDSQPEVYGYYGSLSDVQGNGEWNVDGQLVALDAHDGHVIASVGSSDIFEGVDLPIAIGDVDGDGLAEVVLERYILGPPSLTATEAAGVHLTAYKLNGSTLSRKFDALLSSNQAASGPAIAEIRSAHAGREIIASEDTSNTAGTIRVCSPTATAANCNESIVTPTGVRGVAVGDLTGDGVKEIVANGRTGSSLSVIKTSPALSIVSRADGKLWNTPSLADVDGDGTLDIVNVLYSNFVDDTANPGDVMVRGFDGTNITDKGTLARPGPLRSPTESLSGGVLVDLNNNGSPEFVFGSANNTVTAVRVGGGTPSVLWTQNVGAITQLTPGVGDVTGDGNQDVIVGTSDGRLLVISKNRAPVAPGGSNTIPEDTSKDLTLPGSDADQGDTPVFTIESLPLHGQVLDCSTLPCAPLTSTPYTLASPTVRYQPNSRYAGADAFTYGVSDGKVKTTATESFTMTYVNAAPSVADRSVNAATAQPTHITLTFSDDGGPACPLGPCPPADTYFGITAVPANGRLYDGSASGHQIGASELPYRLAGSLVTYVSNTAYTGPDAFRYKYNDGELESSPTQGGVTITVGATGNNDPVAANGSATTAEDTATTVTLSASDPDGATLTYSIVSLPAHGTLKDGSKDITTVPTTLSGNTVTYTPSANYNGSDAFTFNANDGVTDSNVATESLTITPVNDPPSASPQTVSTLRDTAKTVTLFGSDPEGNALSFTVTALPTHGQLYSGSTTATPVTAAPYALPGSKVTYVPASGSTASDAFSFVARDGQADSSPASVTINVLTPTTTKVTPSNMGLWQSDSSTDNTGGSASGTFVYGPGTPPLGSGSFQQHANTGDKQYLQSFGFNGTPLAGIHLAYSTYTSGTLTPALNLSIDKNGDGTSDESLVFEPYEQASFGAGPSVTPGAWQSWDASAGVWWKGSPSNPRFTLAQYAVANPGAQLATLSQAALKVVIGSTGASWPNFTGNVDRVVVNGSIYNFDPDNSAPIAAGQSVTAKESVAKTITLSASDADNDPLTYIVTSLPAHGTLKDGAATVSSVPRTLSGNTVTYTAAAGYQGSDAFGFKANDGMADSNTATVSITVTLSNHAPSATAQSFTTPEDAAATLTLAGTDADLDPLTFKIATLPANGSVYDGTGTSGHKVLGTELPYTLSGSQVTYLGNGNFNGADAFTFKANDGVVDSAAATVSGTVTPVNDAPAASDQATGTGQETAKTITLTGTDVDGDSLSFTVRSLPTHGSLFDGSTTGSPAITAVPYTLASNKVTYQPASGYLGSDAFTFTANDGTTDSSNTGTVTIGVADATPPDTSITSGPSGAVGSNAATFTFTATEAGTFQCKLDSGSFVACASPATYTGLSEGSHTFSVRGIDGSGNADPTPATRTWTVDTVAPNTSITSGPAGTVRGTSFSFSFSATEGGATFGCSLDGGAFTACTSPKTVSGVSEGPHTFAVKATDAAGNADATPATRTWTVDNTAPAVPAIGAPAGGDTLTNSVVSVSGTAEPGSTIRIYEGAIARGQTSANSSGTWSLQVGFTNGAHTIEATAADAAGNESVRSASVTFTVDDHDAPLPPTISSPAQNAVVPSGTQTVAGSADNGSTVTVSEGASVLKTTTTNGGSWSVLVSLPDGNHTLTAKATDPAGNVSGTASVTFRVGRADPKAPTVTMDTSNPIAQTTINGRATDDISGVDHVDVTFTNFSGVVVTRSATCVGCRPGGLSATWSVSVSGLAAGVYSVQAVGYDVAGNVGRSSSATFLIVPS